jgi:hypothetical protein
VLGEGKLHPPLVNINASLNFHKPANQLCQHSKQKRAIFGAPTIRLRSPRWSSLLHLAHFIQPPIETPNKTLQIISMSLITPKLLLTYA